LVTFSLTLPRASFDLMSRVRAYQAVLEQVRAVPGVSAATAMSSLPLDRPHVRSQTEVTNNTSRSLEGVPIEYQRVMTGFFETVNIPIVQGRAFQPADAGSTGNVAIVNETMAKTYWQGLNPIGQKLRPRGSMPWFTVIGVVRDVKQTSVDQPVRAETYVLVDQIASDPPPSGIASSPTTMHVMVRTTLALAAFAPIVTRIVRDVAPSVPVARLRGMEEVFTESIRRPRLLAQLLTLFSAVAVLLAAIGTYGVLASMVTERRHEMGIRLALGARPSGLLKHVMMQGLTLAIIGVVSGLAGALGLSRLLTSLLFEVQPADGVTVAIAVPLIVGIAALACWVPAWRASRLDPNVVLHAE
jgi:predicted permease